MFFKAVIENSGSINVITEVLTDNGIPLVILILIVSFSTGYLTGFNIASVGILVPVFAPLISAEPVNFNLYISLLFVSSYTGYMLSPLHLCLVLSKEYFESSFLSIYRYLLIPLLVMLATSLIEVLIL